MLEEQTSTRSWASMLRISKSQIQTYLICPRKFWFQYVVGAMPEFVPASLPFGRALHATVAVFYRAVKETGAKPPLESVKREFEVAWETESAGQRLAFKGKTSIDSHIGLGKMLLERFTKRFVHARSRPSNIHLPFRCQIRIPANIWMSRWSGLWI